MRAKLRSRRDPLGLHPRRARRAGSIGSRRTTWPLDQVALDRPGNRGDPARAVPRLPVNIDEYPEFQEYFRTHRPPALVAWGEHDEIFGARRRARLRRDLPDAEIHLLDAGHFALETSGDEIAALVRGFLGRVL